MKGDRYPGPETPFAQEIHAEKHRQAGETFDDYTARVAGALARTPEQFYEFREVLGEQRFLPGGRIQSGVGSARVVTPMNCYVSGTIHDSMSGIMQRATEAAMTMRMGGGIGYDFSTLRPSTDLIRTLGSTASGPVSFMGIYNAVCDTVASAGNRRGAQMAVLRIDHPDIRKFIRAKQNETELRAFNLSIAVTDSFMNALTSGARFPLKFKGRTYEWVDPEALWMEVMRSTWDWADPGVLFIDQINRENNLWYCERIAATNPCFTADTRVWTSDGPKTFAELASSGADVDVLTQTKDNRLVYRTMRNPRRTRRGQPLVKVTFKAHDGTLASIRCTPDHKFFARDGRAVEASKLVAGDSIWSAYRHKANSKGYMRLSNGTTVVSVEMLPEVEDVYCGTVDETSRFFVSLGENDGVLVSNCGEQPLPPYGACLLGSMNLVKYVCADSFDYWKFGQDVRLAVQMLDRVIDVAKYPLSEQEAYHQRNRRMGIGVTGLANAGEMMGFPYGSADFLAFTDMVMRTLRDTAYLESVELAKEFGAFPDFDPSKYLASHFIERLPGEIRNAIMEHGIRNSHLVSIAPTGTISIGADNVSGGIEPPFELEYDRDVKTPDGKRTVRVQDYAYWSRGIRGRTANNLTPDEHLAVQKACQPYVDSAISKTINVGPNVAFHDFAEIYTKAWRLGLKGVTTFRAAGKRFGILRAPPAEGKAEACYIDPETGEKGCG